MELGNVPDFPGHLTEGRDECKQFSIGLEQPAAARRDATYRVRAIHFTTERARMQASCPPGNAAPEVAAAAQIRKSSYPCSGGASGASRVPTGFTEAPTEAA